jgi:predicted DNA-binding transcriptional regulator YafY
MNRVDRLLGLILFLQSRRSATAADMAAHFGLSQRTIYRDMRALGEAGVPVLAEAGVGYSLLRGYLLPPVNFSEEEACALATGAMLLERAAAPSLAGHVDTALQKIRAVLPAARRDELVRIERSMASAASPPEPADQADLALLQKALGRGRVLRFRYQGHGRAESGSAWSSRWACCTT